MISLPSTTEKRNHLDLPQVSTGDLYRESLGATQAVMSQIRRWFGYGENSLAEVEKQEASLAILTVNRDDQSRRIFAVWGTGAEGMFQQAEEEVAGRVMEFLSEDRQAPVDVARRVVDQKIAELFRITGEDQFFGGQRAYSDGVFLLDFVNSFRALETGALRISPSNVEGRFNRSQGALRDLKERTCRIRNEQVNRVQTWTQYIGRRIDESLDRSRALLNSMDRGIERQVQRRSSAGSINEVSPPPPGNTLGVAPAFFPQKAASRWNTMARSSGPTAVAIVRADGPSVERSMG